MIRLLSAAILAAGCLSSVALSAPVRPPKPVEVKPVPNLNKSNVAVYADPDFVGTNPTTYVIDGTTLEFNTYEYHYKGTYAYQQSVGGPGVYRVETTDRVYYVVLLDLTSTDVNGRQLPGRRLVVFRRDPDRVCGRERCVQHGRDDLAGGNDRRRDRRDVQPETVAPATGDTEPPAPAGGFFVTR